MAKSNEPKLLKLKVGKYYKTYGGWKAVIIWDMDLDIDKGSYWKERLRYYVIHKPKEAGKECIITHTNEGKAITTFSVCEPPLFGTHHPADLKEEWK